MLDIPAWARHALARVQTRFPEAFIGGGFLRDLDNHVAPKDVDIFVLNKGDSDDTFGLLQATLAQTHDGADVTVRSKYDHPDLTGVFEFVAADQLPLNIIACKGDVEASTTFMDKQISRFDLGICRIGFTGLTLFAPNAYVIDKARRELRIRNPWNYSRSVERARRIAQRYSGWRIIGHNGEPIADDFAFDVV